MTRRFANEQFPSRSHHKAHFKSLMLLFCLVFLASPIFGAEIFTDRPDYPPGDSVVIMGVGYQSNETVTVQITHLDGNTPALTEYDPWDVSSDGFGDFETFWIVPEIALGETLLVTATGQTSGAIATATFGDASTVLVFTSSIPTTVCPGETYNVCATLYQKCQGGTLVGLPGRQIDFYINSGDCGVDVGQTPDVSGFTDANGSACVNITVPATLGNYSLTVFFTGESKPGPGDPANGVCKADERVQLSNSKDCNDFTVTDAACNEPPTCNVPADQTIDQCTPTQVSLPVSCDDPDGNLAAGYPMIVSGPGSIVEGNWTYTPTGDETVVVTIRCQDDFGEYCEATFTITFDINTAPTATCPGDDQLFVCDLSPITISGFVCNDVDGDLVSCSVDNGTLSGSDVTFTPVAGANVITLTATDACGATATCQTTITVTLNSAPTATCPGDIQKFVCDLSPITVSGFSCDDIDGNLSTCSVDNGTLAGGSVTFTPVAGANVITLTATDDCGETATCQTTVTVTLNTAPTATCPGDIQKFVCDLSPITVSGFSCDDVDGNLATCSVDNGTLAGGSVTFTPVVGANVITLTATDDCGETATCQTTITVSMNSAPTATCPGDIQKFVCDLSPITVSGFSCDDADGNLATCSVDNGTLAGGSVTFTPVAGANAITLTATDDCGETATCQTTITVTLNSAPTATCPGDDQMFVCDLSPITVSGFSCDDIDGNLATCSVDNGTLAGGDVTFTPVVGANVITLTATDDCGETATCQTTITVTLNSAPTAACPGDIQKFVCDLSPITVSGFSCDDVDGNLATCSVDNGTMAEGSVTFTPVVGANVITLTATDDCGETATCQTIVTVTLNSAPTATCPGDVQKFVCDLSPITISGFSCADVDGNLATCSVDNGTLAGGDVTFTPVLGANVITLTATDDCGETATCQTIVTVSMNSAPTATCPGDIQKFVCDLSPITVSGFSCDDADGNLATCSVDNGTLTGGSVTFTPVVGANVIILTATDDCGETATCQTIVTVSMNTAPTATCPGDDQMFVCDLSPITISGFSCDDADGNLATCSVDNGTLAGGDVTFTPVVGANVITLTATDECGETATCQTTVTVSMNSAPTAACPSDIQKFVCDLSPITISGFSCDDIDGNLTTCSVDNGTLAGGSVTFTPVAGANVITLTATDECGATASCQTTVTVTLNSAPTATCPGDDQIFVCDLSPITVSGFSCDDVDGNLATCSVDNGTLAGGDVTFTPVVGANVITLTATDDCGASASCQTTITVTLNSAPTAACPGDDQMFVCDLSPITISGFSCDDIDGNLSTCSVDNGTLAGGDVTFTPVLGANVITLTATDDCSESATCQTTVTIALNSPPVVHFPIFIQEPVYSVCNLDPITLTIFSPISCSDPDGNLATCESNNGTLNGDGSITFTPVEGHNTFIITATDDCGETATGEVTIMIILNGPPTATCPGDAQIFVCDLSPITISGFSCDDVDGNLATCAVDNGTLNGNDVTFTPVAGANVITLTATDECGETATCQTTVTVTVNSAPEASCPADREMFLCSLDEICLPGFSCSDVDGNLVTCETSVGTLEGGTLCFTPVEGVNTVTLTATDECGETTECSVDITVTLNSPPVAHCPGDMTLYLFDLSEVCLSGFYCDDVDGNLVSCEVAGGTFNVDGDVCFTPQTNKSIVLGEGENTITVTATDECGLTSTCQSVISIVLLSDCPRVAISYEQGVLQGHYINVPVTIENMTYEIGGFDFLISYDASALSFLGADPLFFIENCDWEYFTYRNGANGNCGNACPSGLLRVFALAETNDGINHPECYVMPDDGIYDMFNLRFFVSNDRTLECQNVPINFYWGDCGDNTFSSVTGDTLFVDKLIYDFKGNLIWDEEDDATYPESSRIPHLGAPDYCLDNPAPDKPTAIRCVDFRHGGIDIICADDIDARGDLNLNGIPNEIADAVVFTNYFIYGLGAFVVNEEGQIAASDANADGISLSVADLVYIIRVINGDALPIEKLIPYAETAKFGIRGNTIVTDAELGGAAFVFEGDADVSLASGASGMEIKSNFDGANTNVIVYSFDRGAVMTGDILNAGGNLLSVEASSYSGSLFRIAPLPNSFTLNSYPNPFNPSTTIEMSLPVASSWNIDIYNISGQKVFTIDGYNEAGDIKVIWDAAGQSSGIYFIKAQAGEYQATKKAILLK